MGVKIYEYFTAWTVCLFVLTIVLGILFPKKIPLWFFIGMGCLMTMVTVMGTMFFLSLLLYNSNDYGLSYSLSLDFIFHMLPTLVLFMFYGWLSSRFYRDVSLVKSAIFPFLLGIVYILAFNPEDIYNNSYLSNTIIVILSVSIWLSSYQIFVPKQ